MAESVDAPDLKSVENYLVGVQVSLLAPELSFLLMDDFDTDFSLMDLVEEIHDTLDLEDRQSDDETLEAFLNSQWDF